MNPHLVSLPARSASRRSGIAVVFLLAALPLALCSLLLPRPAAAGSSASAASDGYWGGAGDSYSRTWRFSSPDESWTITWAHYSIVDGAPRVHPLDPPWYKETPAAHKSDHDGPGPLGSTTSMFFDYESKLVPGVWGTNFVASWTTNVLGVLGKPAGGANPSWYAESNAKDPMTLSRAELDSIPGPTYNLFIPIRVATSLSSSGQAEFHVWIESTAGATHLLDLGFKSGVAAVTGDLPGVGFVMQDSIVDGPPDASTPRLTLADLQTYCSAHMTASGLDAPITLGVECDGLSKSSGDLPDGFAVDIHVDSRVLDCDASAGFSIPDAFTGLPFLTTGGGVDVHVNPLGPPGPGQGDGSLCLYGYDASAGWILERNWNWTGGRTLSFTPRFDEDLFRLCGSAGTYPVTGSIGLPLQPSSGTSLASPTLPNLTLGFVDPSGNVFNPNLGVGGGNPVPITIQPGLALKSIPEYIGADHWAYLPLQFDLQPDPSRPWLYVNGNPSLAMTQSTYLTLALDGLFDPGGLRIPTLPIQIDFFQGAQVRHFAVTANADPNGNVQVPPVDLGPLLAQPYSLVIGVPGAGPSPAAGLSSTATASAAGYLSLSAVMLRYGAAATTAVEDPATPLSDLHLAPAAPNPFRAATRIAFALQHETRVRAAIYDMQGRQVRSLANGPLEAGRHAFTWDGRDAEERLAPEGLYVARVEAGDRVETRKISLIR